MSEADKILISLFRTHNRALKNFANRRVGRQDAEDIVQDAYLRLLQDDKTQSLEHPRSYLFRITANLAVDLKRKLKVRTDQHVDDTDFERLSQTPNALCGSHVVEIIYLRDRLADLPPTCRSVFLLSRLYGLTFPEIAARLDISLRTVNRNMLKASELLDKHFER